MSGGETAPRPSEGLLQRAKRIEGQVQRIEVRNRTDSEDSALSEALDTFESQRAVLHPLVEQARALQAHGDDVELPDPSGLIRGIKKLADGIDTDPIAVRRRRNQVNQLEKLVGEVRRQVGRAVEARLREAKGDANASLVDLLRMAGLDRPADALAVALRTLDDLAADGPRSVENWRQVDSAAAAIRDAVSKSGTPIMDFTREVLGGRLTLADLDDELLAELKRQDAARNFSVRLSSG